MEETQRSGYFSTLLSFDLALIARKSFQKDPETVFLHDKLLNIELDHTVFEGCEVSVLSKIVLWSM